MKYLLLFLCSASTWAYGQLTIETAQDSLQKYRMGRYSYHEQFVGHKGYGAPVILTNDGGAAAFGDGENGSTLIKLDKTGKKEWEVNFKPQFTEMESQSVVQDINGNFYVCMLSYDAKRYRGGSERIICLDKKGKILWDKTLGKYTLMNNPTISYLKALPDGRIEFRGHVVKETPAKGKDPVYRYWEGWINSKGVYTQKSGDVLDWSNPDWKKLYEPE